MVLWSVLVVSFLLVFFAHPGLGYHSAASWALAKAQSRCQEWLWGSQSCGTARESRAGSCSLRSHCRAQVQQAPRWGWGLQVSQAQNCTTDSSEIHLPLAFSLIHCPSCPVLWHHRNYHKNASRAVSFNISTLTWLVSFMNQMLFLLLCGVISFSVPVCSKWPVQCTCHFIIMLFQKCHLTYQCNLRKWIFSCSSSNFGSYRTCFWVLIPFLFFPNENWILHIGIFFPHYLWFESVSSFSSVTFLKFLFYELTFRCRFFSYYLCITASEENFKKKPQTYQTLALWYLSEPPRVIASKGQM